jgi:hypothetical protein
MIFGSVDLILLLMNLFFYLWFFVELLELVDSLFCC